MSCGEEAATAVRELQLILQALGTSQANMAGKSPRRSSLLFPFSLSAPARVSHWSVVLAVSCSGIVCVLSQPFLPQGVSPLRLSRGFSSEPLTRSTMPTAALQAAEPRGGRSGTGGVLLLLAQGAAGMDKSV